MFEFMQWMRHQYGEDTSRDIQKLLETTRKLERCKAAIKFIRSCFINGKLPNFTRLKLTKQHDQKLLRKIRWELTEHELDYQFKRKTDLEKSDKRLRLTVSPRLQEHDWIELMGRIEDVRHAQSEKQKDIHNRKLEALSGYIPFKIDPKNITTRRKPTNNDQEMMDVIFNHSNYDLSVIERSVLSKGLKYGIHDRRVDTYELLARFELLA